MKTIVSVTDFCFSFQKLSTVVSLHLTPMGVSWTRLSRDDHVDKWDFYGFAALPKKVLPVDTFQLVQKRFLLKKQKRTIESF